MESRAAASVQRAQLLFDSVATPLEQAEVLARLAPRSEWDQKWTLFLCGMAEMIQSYRPPWSASVARWLVRRNWEETGRKHAGYAVGPVARCRRVFKRGSFALYQASERKSRSLVVAFTGTMFRVGMPLPVFLQSAAYKNLDVVVVWPNRRTRSYAGPLAGLGDGLFESIDSLRSQLSGYDLRDSCVIATSAGTVPALVAAKLWGVQSIVAAGTVPQAETLFREASLFAPSPNGGTRYRFVFGEHARGADAAVATRLAEVTGGATEIIRGAPHVPLFPLVERREFSDWLDTRLFNPLGVLTNTVSETKLAGDI